ncbi:polysaccharide biosynthesis protein [Clostridium perfringens]|uniref:PssD/Cps14F family polysaccharide biosynthesis glycosyltransferase n=1 Tax=Clostridium perfringens TaxID=1502 RepID=UPI000D9499CF|nr:PssD/Cps14F family polysaccharide biosynthesis glycosyltransferase [Clostridium perfringens]MDM1006629.1 PssD/Cps14F family polysaccharide biosynthesis glycosyltransferase [Clostridium perfringens]UBK58659.1 polysaccharide biosynthesis protein [Clostridium perfringens]UBK61191.1 polysaccharide biosynthesis protein [Clostridium perfringens]SQB23571.1 polysaccharide biosynthesis protein CpsF [Clostridium perfringens]VTQ58473.1 polysaccharide biosynthesis protein CpsF [Clostridium perfringens]
MEKKICFIASSGGHFEQLMMLKPIMKKHRSFIVTEKTNYSVNTDQKVYYLKQVNRHEVEFILLMILNSFKSLKIFLKEKPDVIISTGALSVIPICVIGKVFGKKIIFIESFAKITSPTLTGRFIYKFADRFYIQWESLRKFYPNAINKGGIY